MLYSDYQKSRDFSWDLLLDAGITELPVRVTEICRHMRVPVFTFKELPDVAAAVARSRPGTPLYGFLAVVEGELAILYDDTRPSRWCRFTIAHELGHFLLQHITKRPFDDEYVTPSGARPAPEEQAANVFARDLLAPACVLWGLGVTSAQQIYNICNITEQAAKYRMQRMDLLYERNRKFQIERGYGCFLLSGKEKLLFEQFRPYIEASRL